MSAHPHRKRTVVSAAQPSDSCYFFGADAGSGLPDSSVGVKLNALSS
jgi:hypothetical protein